MNLKFLFETSCKDGININEVFEKLVEDILNKRDGSLKKKIKFLKIEKKEEMLLNFEFLILRNSFFSFCYFIIFNFIYFIILFQ